jgi:hypothetical protein
VDSRFHESDEVLELYALNRLSDSDVIRIEEHLIVCETCRDHLDETAGFALVNPAIRNELRSNPVTVRASGNWLAWLTTGFRPQFALAGAFAIALLAVIVFRAGNNPIAPVASLQLTAMRGTEIRTVAPSRKLDLTFADALADQGALKVEVVDASGSPVWQGAATPGNTARVEIVKELAQGDYYARLYDSQSHLLHEYSFRVKK